MSDALAVLQAERERRRRLELAREAPKWDWYGPDCGCPQEQRKQDGSCPLHKRARPKQRPPEGDWITWFMEMGRGWGKTEAGAQWIQWCAETLPGGLQFIIAAPVAGDIRDVMVDGPSGILKIAKPWFFPEYQTSKSRLVWPNGTVGLLLSADEPERFRGKQAHKAWCDEICSWRYPDAFTQLQLGLRLGDNPQFCITTTPKPLDWVRKIKKLEGTVVVKGSTYENVSHLAKVFIHTIIKPLEGTRLGRQELEAEDLEDTPGALWNTALLDLQRIAPADVPELVRVVVAVDPSVADPSVSTDESTAECGIVVGGYAAVNHPTLGMVRHGYTLADRSMRGHPHAWGQAVINSYREFGADMIVAEVNNGGALVATNLHALDANVPVKLLHASRGKHTRAEPIATLYEQRRVFHVQGADLSLLENQMCSWVPGNKSPDRMDALVWLHTELFEGQTEITFGPHPFEDWR